MRLNIGSMIKAAGKFISKHTPEILTAVGVAGLVATAGLTAKGTVKAVKEAEKIEDEHEAEADESGAVKTVTKKEVFKRVWKYFIPALTSLLLSACAIIFANTTYAKRYAILASSYKVLETAYDEYRDQIKEVIGAEKEQEVNDKVVAKTIEKASDDMNIPTSERKDKFLDIWSGQIIESTLEDIRKGINDANAYLNAQDYMDVNEYYRYIGGKSIGAGFNNGFNRYRDGLIRVNFKPTICENRPAWAMTFDVEPRSNYDMFS